MTDFIMRQGISENAHTQIPDDYLARTLESGQIRSIIFDLDGVLINSSEGIHAATNYTLKKLGAAERTILEVRQHIGSPLEDMFEIFAPGADWETIRTLFREHSFQLIVEKCTLTPHALDTIKTCHQNGFELLVGSTKVSRHISGILERFELMGYFRAYTGGDEARPKPAPDIFVSVLEKAGIKPSEALVVGDTVNDVLAARAANVSVVTVESDLGDRDALERDSADMHFANLSEFLQFLRFTSPLFSEYDQRT